MIKGVEDKIIKPVKEPKECGRCRGQGFTMIHPLCLNVKEAESRELLLIGI